MGKLDSRRWDFSIAEMQVFLRVPVQLAMLEFGREVSAFGSLICYESR